MTPNERYINFVFGNLDKDLDKRPTHNSNVSWYKSNTDDMIMTYEKGNLFYRLIKIK